MPKKGDKYFVWVIAYIDSDTFKLAKKELKRFAEYREVEIFIPTVKVLKKTFKGEDQFDEVPLLFQYGFFKIPRKYAISQNYLDNMKMNISCIYGWLRDPHKGILKDATRKSKKIKDRDIPIATATSQQITELVKTSFDYSIHSAEDISSIKIGDYITLRGYPFDNIQAEIIDIDERKKQAKVKIHLFDGMRQVDVSFDNILFTVYHKGGHEDTLSNFNPIY